jgi:hypothetical protein
MTNGSCIHPNSTFLKCEDDTGNIDTWYDVKVS